MGVSLRGIVEGIVEDSSESDGLPPGSGADIFNNTFYCTGLNLLFSSFLNLTLSEIEMYKLQLNSLPSQHGSIHSSRSQNITVEFSARSEICIASRQN